MSTAPAAGQRKAPRLEALTAGGRERRRLSGPGDGPVPFPHQKAKGRTASAECGWHHEVLRKQCSRPIAYGGRAFFCGQTASGRGVHAGPPVAILPLRNPSSQKQTVISK